MGKSETKAEMEEKVFNKNILIAVDESNNARRAVSYVGQILGGLAGFTVCILHVIPEPEEDYFPSAADKEKWFTQYKKKVGIMLADYRQLLIMKGFAPDNISTRSTVRYCPSIAECILSERDETGTSTIVVGRQGISRSEEFLFGSVSSKIVNHARKCSVWVVE